MKRAIMTTVMIGALMAGGMGGCQGGLAGPDPDGYVDSVVNEIGTQAAEELRKAFSSEISDFFKSDDLSKTLGVDSGEQEKLEESIKTFINQYSSDEEKLSEAKESLDTLLQNTDGLSAEEIQDRIEGIFAE